jgi:hypothetical protein
MFTGLLRNKLGFLKNRESPSHDRFQHVFNTKWSHDLDDLGGIPILGNLHLKELMAFFRCKKRGSAKTPLVKHFDGILYSS